MVTIEQLTIADEPESWSALGFAVEGDRCRIGAVELRLAGREAGRGLVGWTLRGLPHDGDAALALDGLPTTRAETRGAGGEPAESSASAAEPPHPNGITRIDHVVAVSPDLDRTVAALQAAGLDLRRIREQPTPAGAPRQAFFRLGAEILEAIQEPAEVSARAGGSDRGAFFWGIALRSDDLDATVARLGANVSEIRDAVQRGRRIASLRREAGLALPVALMTG
ncbi:VOC family protein [Conexibacter stalactiti]|uniref:VOC family protein n=1 Tax=Conexibacter stalactiti TaxID=1940611 RepID=A0ABU4HMC8_9ACTN|nr:VOC family protein [Conexibacter stalactiti]MDW5594452.1 VOC family protein [Conexibacter stalactiti]MEC5035094.1 VOC family protein [Conexibacter stalactiti]